MFTWALIDTSGQASAGDLARIVETLDKLYVRFADAWSRVPSHGIAATSADAIAGATFQVRLVGDDPNVPNALGFHDEQGDVPYAEIELAPILQNGGEWLSAGSAGASVASVVAHELFEATIDLNCNGWEYNPSTNLFLAREVGDPVQGAIIKVQASDGTTVDLSDAVVPAYFDLQAPADGTVAFSLASTPTAPWQNTPGGYQILFDPTKVRDPNGPISSVWGDAMPQWQRDYKRRAAGRLARRTSKQAA